MARSVRKIVQCSQCAAAITRLIWNYGKNRPITEFFRDNACKGLWQRAQRENLGFTRDWLYDQYVVKGRTANDIAAEVGRDPKRVWEWIVDYGIPTRPRGVAGMKNLVRDGSAWKGRKHTASTRMLIRAARLSDGHVPYLRHGKHWMKTAPRGEHPNWKGGLTPERQSVCASPEWREAVKRVWARARAKCERCRVHHNTRKRRGTFHIHHVVSFVVRELRTTLSNLVLLCRECHLFVHSRKNVNREFIGVYP